MAQTHDRAWLWWGAVPADSDVRPFSALRRTATDRNRNNKRHHFVSVVYMNGFANEQGRVWAYRADDPDAPLHVRPAKIGFEKFYYSQKLKDGTQDNHTIEDLWNPAETVWPETRRALAAQRVSPTVSFNVLGMATIQKTRVPAARERNEMLLAAKLRAEAQALEALGRLPPELQRYAGQLDTVPVGVNPHETLRAMEAEFRAFGDLCFRIGFEVLHNHTGLPFITSDNPVCIYDPRQPAHARRPYDVDDDIELIFPLDSRMLLRGSSRLSPANHVVRHRRTTDASVVRRLNRTVAQFAYRLLIAPDRSADALARSYAATCPTVEVEVRRIAKEIQIVWRHVFGPRPDLSPFIDTPETAARLEAQLTGVVGDGPGGPVRAGPVDG